ncbi:MAG: protein phosphatase [Pirellulaceae bacterium]|nr:protein phosphatase [Pirellulaceae bacterium]
MALLHEHEIRAVVDLAINEAPAVLPRDFVYCRFPLNDGGGNEPAMLRLIIETVVALVRNQTRTLVACSAGMSRAPAISAAAMALMTRRPPEECLARVIAHAPNDVSPLFWSDVKLACLEVH